MQCSNCSNHYQINKEEGIPRFLRCGHTFCSSCIQNFVNFHRKSTFVVCPTCRYKHQMNSSDIKLFPKNYLAIQFLSGDNQFQQHQQHQQHQDYDYYDDEEEEYQQQVIHFISRENAIFFVAPQVAVISDVVRWRIEDDASIDTFRFPKLTSAEVDQVIKFMYHFQHEPYQEIYQALSSEQSWYYQYLRGDPNYPFGDAFLQQLVYAADDMEVNPLLELAGAVLASKEPGRCYEHPVFISQEYSP